MPQDESCNLSARRVGLLYLLFFLICLGLGYPILNRIEWQHAPGGLVDLQQYARLITDPPSNDPALHTQFRILVPMVARIFYHLSRNHIRSWDPVMFGLLVANALFVAAAVTLLVLVAMRLTGNYAVAIGSALLYLLNFAVPNLRLYGFIDSGEAFFLLAVLWALVRERYALLPLCAIAGACAKETFVGFLLVFTATWWLLSPGIPRRAGAWIVSSWILGFAALSTLQWSILGVFRSPLQFALALHGHARVSHQVMLWFSDRNLLYTFVWLLPLGIPHLLRFPRNWRLATTACCLSAFALDAYYGAAPGTMARAQFTLAAPLLTVSAASLLFHAPAREM